MNGVYRASVRDIRTVFPWRIMVIYYTALCNNPLDIVFGNMIRSDSSECSMIFKSNCLYLIGKRIRHLFYDWKFLDVQESRLYGFTRDLVLHVNVLAALAYDRRVRG